MSCVRPGASECFDKGPAHFSDISHNFTSSGLSGLLAYLNTWPGSKDSCFLNTVKIIGGEKPVCRQAAGWLPLNISVTITRV